MDTVMAWCGAVPVGGGAVLGLLLAGLAGSPMHCVPMCGGFVLGQVADRMARMPASALCEWRRIGAAALLPYHLGRLTTYAALGALAGLGGATLGRVPWFAWLSGGLLLLASALFVTQAVRRMAPGLGRHLPGLDGVPTAWGQLIRRITAGLSRDRPLSGYALGLALGFLPCGFLYAALAVAAASFSPLIGAIGMAAFGLGTVPALIVVGVAGQAAGSRYHRGLAHLAPAVMLLNAALLAGLAVRGLV
jgi:sulfite exporter TauE/SafE